ncbi:MAG: hypothetical protein HWE15_03010 [Algoriphagus sp.]|uniref:hypothetical protein n=1 Tax=Algoriphagus sp. TaxID=1872435 RepID=UPI0017A064A9|nr:hypothetical protein [Algoriphagus sp.]NVJ85245.1 hypothetical protein [Algoriphagus sp.]
MPFKLRLAVLMSLIFLSACRDQESNIQLRSENLVIKIGSKGELRGLTNPQTQKDYLPSGQKSSLIQLKTEQGIIQPQAVRWNNDRLVFDFQNDTQITIQVEQKTSHITFEVVEANGSDQIEWLAWGPIPTSIDQIIGETIGVVRDQVFAIGIQSLNPKTLGGYPWRDNDTTPEIDIFEQEDYSDLDEKGKRMVLYRVEAAKPEDFGSTLQAYVRNRNSERIVENLNHEHFLSPTFEDSGIIGSKIALFGSPSENTLETIGIIEVEESLPHPIIDGEWGKTSKSASSAYLIYNFSEKTIDKAISLVQKAGLNYLYHDGPFKNWGHFELDPTSFPNGWESLKACIDKAEKEGIHVGVHTLSNFITTNDPYVTPVPDDRLGVVGYSELAASIDSEQTEIPIESSDFFNQYQNNHLKTVKIGKELIRYGSVSESSPWKLLDCERGAWGTEKASHMKRDQVSKLADHAYKVFLTNPELSIEMAKKLADLYNSSGLRQISFDGLEGNRSTGMGNYGEILFTTTWWNNLSEEVKSHMVIDASRTTHYFWHIYSRMNWGEPWYAGFRESQTEYRLKNQAYFQRNLMPGMLGWFSMRPNTTVEDVEWMLARSAAFDAGYAFVVREEALQANGQADQIFQLIGDWEKLRMAEAFSEAQKERMKDIQNEFHLESIGENSWNLSQIHTSRFNHQSKIRQPGEPLFTSHQFTNPVGETVLHFILNADDAQVSDIVLELNNSKTFTLPVSLQKGESLRYEGGEFGTVLDQNLNIKRTVKIDPRTFKLNPGNQTISIDCAFQNGGENAQIKVELRIPDEPETITLN